LEVERKKEILEVFVDGFAIGMFPYPVNVRGSQLTPYHLRGVPVADV
jgi:hypothetical protein